MKKRKNKLIANPPPLNEWTGPKFKEGWDHYRKKGENSLNESQITECIVPTTLLKTATTKMWKYNYQNKWFVDITQLMNKIFYKFKQNEANFEMYTFESNKVKIHELWVAERPKCCCFQCYKKTSAYSNSIQGSPDGHMLLWTSKKTKFKQSSSNSKVHNSDECEKVLSASSFNST